MKKDQIVTIYNSKLNGKMIVEGKAKLIKKHENYNDPERWTIKFIDDNFLCDRFIYPNNDK